jgi:hypothetical protein
VVLTRRIFLSMLGVVVCDFAHRSGTELTSVERVDVTRGLSGLAAWFGMLFRLGKYQYKSPP